MSVRIVPPVLVLAPVLAGTGRIGEPVTVSAGSWSGVPAPSTSVAWLRDGAAIAGATGTSYTPVAADDGKRLSARVTATNAGGSAETVTAALSITYAPPVAKGGLEEEIFDLGSGVETVAAGADFTGENLQLRGQRRGGDDRRQDRPRQHPDRQAVQATVTVTATNSGGSARSSFQVTVEAEDIPFALEAEDVEIVTAVWRPEAQETWFTPVVRFPGLAGETVDAIEWTTSSKDPIPETECEVVTKVGPDSYQLYMRDSAKNAPGASPRVDYSVFKARRDEAARGAALPLAAHGRGPVVGMVGRSERAARRRRPRRRAAGSRPRRGPRRHTRPTSPDRRASSSSAAAHGTSGSLTRRSAAGSSRSRMRTVAASRRTATRAPTMTRCCGGSRGSTATTAARAAAST